MTSFPNLVLATLILAVIQVLAAIPWFWALDGRSFRKWISDPKTLVYLLGGIIGLSLLLAWYLRFRSSGEVENLKWYGRMFGSLLHLQLILDFAILAPRLVLSVWPKGGAVALSAMRESIRQPMFWLISGLAALLIVISTFIPYFTLGEDYKLMKQVGYDAVMLFSALFGLLTASVSVNEEIEGRTAITVISKPVNRRQFLIGKYVGILLACWVMMLLLGWVLTWALHWKPRFDALDDAFDPMPVEVSAWTSAYFDKIVPTPEASSFAQGMGAWVGETFAHHLGIFRISGQVMIMLAICTALATRVQFVVNLVICLSIFLIGNLAPIMVHVTQNTGTDGNAALQLVSFIAQLLSAVFPALNSFDMGPAIIRDSPLSTASFSGFVLMVFLYALLYSVIVLLIGLLLFEERDLA
jgi:ABC-type transport system involved in multi-copper enzyme maturation permease subunit